MKKFKFPLQAVLTLRRMKEEQALEIYAKSVQECASKRADLANFTRRADDLENLLRQKNGEIFSATMRMAYLHSLRASREEVTRRAKLLEDAEKLREKRLGEFLDRKRKKEILENLNARQLENHLAESRRTEEIEIEDLVISRLGTAKIAG